MATLCSHNLAMSKPSLTRPANLNVRFPTRSLLKRVRRAARREGVSLNRFIVDRLASLVAAGEGKS